MNIGWGAWADAWQELGVTAGDEALFQRVLACWSEAHRHYHTLQHLHECLLRFDEVRGSAQRPGEIALALWFHDAFYDPRRHDNEARSAQWARESVFQAGLAQDIGDRVHALVMATCHDVQPEDADAQLLVDIDLSILGAAPERFDESDAQIRAEYAHVPEQAYREGRQRILGSFLARPRLYSTDHFHSRLEAQARENLNRALARLGG